MELIINDYKNIEKCKISIIDNLVILVGKNNVGKSNVLKAILENAYTINDCEHEFTRVLHIDANLNLSLDNYLIKYLCDSLFGEGITYEKLYENIKDLVEELPDDFACERYLLNLGSGETRKVIFELVNRFVMNSSEKVIILVDHPDLFAHPSLARKICIGLRNLTQLGHLVVATTHSDAVVENLYRDIRQVVKLTLVDKKVCFYQMDLDEYVENVSKFYQSTNVLYLPNGKINESLVYIVRNNLRSYCKSILRDKTLKILFTDILVIGEGESEEVLFDYIFNLDSNSLLNTMEVDYFTGYGKFYLPFYIIFANMYGSKVICMYDLDDLKNKSHRAYYNAFYEYELEHRNSFISWPLDTDLESVLDIYMPKHRAEKPLHIYNEVRSPISNVMVIYNELINLLNKFK